MDFPSFPSHLKTPGQGTPEDSGGGNGGDSAKRLHGDVGAALGEHPCDVAGNGGFFEKEKREKGVEKNIYIDVCIHTLTYIDIHTYMLRMWVCIYTYEYRYRHGNVHIPGFDHQ